MTHVFYTLHVPFKEGTDLGFTSPEAALNSYNKDLDEWDGHDTKFIRKHMINMSKDMMLRVYANEWFGGQWHHWLHSVYRFSPTGGSLMILEDTMKVLSNLKANHLEQFSNN